MLGPSSVEEEHSRRNSRNLSNKRVSAVAVESSEMRSKSDEKKGVIDEQIRELASIASCM